MNTKILSRMAFVLFAGICMAGCSSDGDDIINKELPIAPENKPNTIVLTGTLSMGEIEGTTRAVDANGTFHWEPGEQIAVRYKNNDGIFTTTQATIDGSSMTIQGSNTRLASFSVELYNVDPEYGVRIAYPYNQLTLESLDDSSTEDFTFDLDNLKNQDGTMESISENLSWAKTAAPVAITVSGSTATLNNNAVLVNQNAICKFNLTTADGTTALKASKLEITLGNNNTPTYTICPQTDEATSEYYVAIAPHEGKVKLTAHYTGGKAANETKLDQNYLNNNNPSVGMMIGTVNPAATTAQQAYLFDKDANVNDSHQFGSKTNLLAGKFYTQTVTFNNVLIPIAVVAYDHGVTNYWNKFLALAVEDVTDGEHTVTPSAGSTMASTWASSHKVKIGVYDYTSVYDKFYDIVAQNQKSETDEDWSASNSAKALAGTGQWRVPTVTDWRYILESLGDQASATDPKGVMDYNGVYPNNYVSGIKGYNNGPVSQASINDFCGNQYLQEKVYWTDSEVSGEDKKAWRYDFAYGYFEWTSTESTAYIRLVLAY